MSCPLLQHFNSLSVAELNKAASEIINSDKQWKAPVCRAMCTGVLKHSSLAKGVYYGLGHLLSLQQNVNDMTRLQMENELLISGWVFEEDFCDMSEWKVRLRLCLRIRSETRTE